MYNDLWKLLLQRENQGSSHVVYLLPNALHPETPWTHIELLASLPPQWCSTLGSRNLSWTRSQPPVSDALTQRPGLLPLVPWRCGRITFITTTFPSTKKWLMWLILFVLHNLVVASSLHFWFVKYTKGELSAWPILPERNFQISYDWVLSELNCWYMALSLNIRFSESNGPQLQHFCILLGPGALKSDFCPVWHIPQLHFHWKQHVPRRKLQYIGELMSDFYCIQDSPANLCQELSFIRWNYTMAPILAISLVFKNSKSRSLKTKSIVKTCVIYVSYWGQLLVLIIKLFIQSRFVVFWPLWLVHILQKKI